MEKSFYRIASSFLIFSQFYVGLIFIKDTAIGTVHLIVFTCESLRCK